jgi:hypothetical protein
MVDEHTDHAGVLADGVTEALGTVGQPEPEVIRCDATEVFTQLDDDVAVQETPRRIAVAQQDRRAVPLVDVVDATVRGVEPA